MGRGKVKTRLPELVFLASTSSGKIINQEAEKEPFNMSSLTQTGDWRKSAESLQEEMEKWDGFPEAFRFRPGDTLTGRLLNMEQGHTDYGTSPILTIQTTDGKLHTVWVFHTVLKSKLMSLNPRTGDVLSIKRLEDSEKGYKSYHVRVHNLRIDRDFKSLPSVQEEEVAGELESGEEVAF